MWRLSLVAASWAYCLVAVAVLIAVAFLAGEHSLWDMQTSIAAAHGLSRCWPTGLVAPRYVGSSRTGDQTSVPWIARQILNHWTTREVRNVMVCIGNTGRSLHTFLLFYDLMCQALCFSLEFTDDSGWTILDFCLCGCLCLMRERSEWVNRAWKVQHEKCELAGLAWLSAGRRLYVKMERRQLFRALQTLR